MGFLLEWRWFRRLVQWTLSFFPIRANDREHFITLLEKHGRSFVAAQGVRLRPSFALSGELGYVGSIGDFTYQGRFWANARGRRPILWEQDYDKVFGSESGWADSPERNLRALAVLITLDSHLMVMVERIPGLKTGILAPNNEWMLASTIAEANVQAQQLGLQPFGETFTDMDGLFA